MLQLAAATLKFKSAMIQPCCSWLAETAELVNGSRNENGEWEVGPGKSGLVNKDRNNRHDLRHHVRGSGALSLHCKSHVNGVGRVQADHHFLPQSLHHNKKQEMPHLGAGCHLGDVVLVCCLPHQPDRPSHGGSG